MSPAQRFFSSAAGIQFHQQFMETREPPRVEFNTPERASWMIGRAGDSGAVPRGRVRRLCCTPAAGTALANRREDVLVIRP
jgi:hypothetical protein